jgi:DNA-binding GntR family transcriptional regulator
LIPTVIRPALGAASVAGKLGRYTPIHRSRYPTQLTPAGEVVGDHAPLGNLVIARDADAAAALRVRHIASGVENVLGTLRFD